ncbi:MAG: peptide chain release factor N(5)-glutamine methyltransferase [Betaproteobacteria bacterium]
MKSTVEGLLAGAADTLATDEGRRDAQVLLGHVLGVSRAWLVAHDGDAVDDSTVEAFRKLILLRHDGEPVAYLLGVREFHGLDFRVTPDVLIPRPETETLVDAGLEKLDAMPGRKVLDLGTGSGCVAVSIAFERPAAQVTAIDLSADALDVARSNATALGQKVEFLQGRWFVPLAQRRFDLIVSNPPYVAAGDPHLRQGDLRFEPIAALISGPDGLNDIRVIVGGAVEHLLPGGWLLFEHGYDQAETCRDLLAKAGFGDLKSWPDLAGIARVAGGRLLTPNSATR